MKKKNITASSMSATTSRPEIKDPAMALGAAEKTKRELSHAPDETDDDDSSCTNFNIKKIKMDLQNIEKEKLDNQSSKITNIIEKYM